MKCCEKQTYKCDVVIKIQNHMQEYRNKRILNGFSDSIGIEKCILKEIMFLWSNGVKTYGSCCGHRENIGWVNVDEESFNKMESLGYNKFKNKLNNFTYELKGDDYK